MRHSSVAPPAEYGSGEMRFHARTSPRLALQAALETPDQSSLRVIHPHLNQPLANPACLIPTAAN